MAFDLRTFCLLTCSTAIEDADPFTSEATVREAGVAVKRMSTEYTGEFIPSIYALLLTYSAEIVGTDLFAPGTTLASDGALKLKTPSVQQTEMEAVGLEDIGKFIYCVYLFCADLFCRICRH